MKTKILHVITKSNWGGAQRYVFDLATHLPSDQFEVAVAAGGDELLLEKLRRAGIRTITIPGLERDISLIKELRSFWGLFRIFTEERPDVVHLNSGKAGAIGAVAARLAAIRLRKPIRIVFTAHGWSFLERRSMLWRTLIWTASWLTAFFAHRVVIISTRDMAAAHRMPLIPRKHFAYIPLGIPPIIIPDRGSARARLEEHLKASLQGLLIGTIAELTPNKGIDVLIDALHHLKPHSIQARTIIIGDGEHRMIILERIHERELSEHVFLTGFLEDAASLLPAFDLFVLPSRKEGLPYTILEAMTVKVPVISTQVGGIPDLIEHGVSGLLVSPDDSEALSSAILNLLEDADRRQEFAAQTHKRLEEKFSFHGMMEKTVKLYLGS